MKTKFLIPAFLLSYVCVAQTQFDPKEWPFHKLVFSKEGTLKDIFDSGIRPYRFPGLERSTLEFKHAKVSVALQTSEQLPPIDVEWAGISPLEGGILSELEMTSPNLSIAEAEKAMSFYLAKGGRTSAELKAFFKAVESNPTGYDDPYNGRPDKFEIVWTEANGPTYAVFFKKTFDRSMPLSFALKVDWFKIRSPIQLRSFYKEPIPPPPGYEHVSMDAPKNFGPDSAVDVLRSKGIPISGDRLPSELSSSPSPTMAPSTSPTATPKVDKAPVTPSIIEKESQVIPRWTLVVLVVVIGILSFIIYRLFRKHSR